MAEFTNSSIVNVAAGQNVPLTETAVCGKSCIVHREGAGIVTLRGITNQCKARYKVSFGANIAIPTGGTVGAITPRLQSTENRLLAPLQRLLPQQLRITLTCLWRRLWTFRAVAA